MNNEQLIVELKKQLILEGYAKSTFENYVRIVRKFLADKQPIQLFLIMYASNSRSTMRTYFYALQFFHRNVLRKPFKENIPLSSVKQKEPIRLTRDETKKLLDKTTNLKHKTILSMLYYGALRLHECRLLSWEDIDFTSKIIRVTNPKSNKPREVALHDQLIETLYKLGKRQKGTIITTEQGKPYHKRTVQLIVRVAAHRAHIQKHVTPSTLRSSYADHLLEAGTDVRYVQQILGK